MRWHAKGFVMTKYSTLLAATAPLALIGAMLPTAAIAQVTTARPPAVIRTPVKPATVEKKPRIRQPVTVTETPPAEEEQVQVQSAEAQSSEAKVAPIRNRTPRVNTTVPVETPSTPRVRTRTMPTVEATPAPATPDRRRVRNAPPRVDTTVPVEVDRTPRRTPPPVAEPAPSREDTTPQRRRGQGTGQGTGQGSVPASDTQTLPKKPPRTARIDDDGGAKMPRTYVGSTKSGAVVLKPGTQGQVVSKLPVVRTLDIAQLTASPIMTLGGTTFNFSPMLDNPKSLPNITNNLLAMPNLVEVHPAKAPMTAYQIKQGVVVNSTLSYTLKPGACSTAANRAAIQKAGIACFTYRNPSSQEAAFSNPAAVEYIADPALRSSAIADARVRSDAVMGDIQSGVTEFRAMLADPVQRAELTQTLGAAEVARLESLDDTALAGELVNMQEVQIEETGFIPMFQSISPDQAMFDAAKKSWAARMQKLAAADAQLAPSTQPTSYQIGDTVFLTGFTLSNASEWRKGISTTIKWCFVGCKRTYYVEAWAGFHYEFGLRFPMKLSGEYKYNGSTAELLPNLTMFDGNADDYRKAGLPEAKVFNGKEFVAGFGFNAGFAANLPFHPLIKPPELGFDIDLTALKEFPFKGGNVAPPNPNDPGPTGDIFFRDVDLLNNTANLGFVAIKVHPGLRVTLTSDRMGLTLNGTKFDNETPSIALPMGKAQVSSFKIADPTYNIKFSLTPGLEARLSINLAVWGTSFEWPIWLSAATITMPAGGIDFSCHEGTVCSRQFNLSPTGAVSQFQTELKAWGVDYDARWLKHCVDETCRTSVKIKRYDTIEWGIEQELANPDITMGSIKGTLTDADNAAVKYNQASVARKAQASSDTSAAMGLVAIAFYTPQCLDSICVDAVAALAAQMGPRAAEITLYQRHLDPTEINKMVNKEFSPKFTAEVDASKQRRDMKNAKMVQGQVEQSGGKKPIIRRKK